MGVRRENIAVPIERDETIAKYHFHYLHDLFRYKKIRYSKNKYQHVATISYFNGIQSRIRKTEHISSFKSFIDFILSENDLMD